ncbi:MAG: VWA domain-containing protein [Bianqueaceae bacterium]
MLYDSYQKRDKVGMVAFRRQQAEILLDVTSSVNLAQKKLQQLPTGGRTPLASGLFQAWQMLKGRRYKDPEMLPILVLVTDGRANAPLWSSDPVEDALKVAGQIQADHIQSIVVDTEQDFISCILRDRWPTRWMLRITRLMSSGGRF